MTTQKTVFVGGKKLNQGEIDKLIKNIEKKEGGKK